MPKQKKQMLDCKFGVNVKDAFPKTDGRCLEMRSIKENASIQLGEVVSGCDGAIPIADLLP